MRVTTGRGVDGKMVLEGEQLSDGTVVTVVVRDDVDEFDVSPEDEQALREAMAQADQGHVISWEQLRAQLRGPA